MRGQVRGERGKALVGPNGHHCLPPHFGSLEDPFIHSFIHSSQPTLVDWFWRKRLGDLLCYGLCDLS